MKALSYLFNPDFSKLTAKGVLTALGHAFFSLSLGIGAMIAYGSYLQKDISLVKATFAITVLDTLAALLAGIAIFSIVFANDLNPGQGPGLIFVTLPLAFAQMPLGGVLGVLFFVLVIMAAWSSALSLLEVIVEYLQEKGLSRTVSTLAAGLSTWAFGITALLSFNVWNDVHLLSFLPGFEKKTLFDLYDYATANLLMPLGALFIALFAGYVIPPVESHNNIESSFIYILWRMFVRYVTPICIALVFVYNLF